MRQRLTEELIEEMYQLKKQYNLSRVDLAKAFSFRVPTLYDWAIVARKVDEKIDNGAKLSDFSKYEKLCVKFVERMDYAETEYKMALLKLVQNAAVEDAKHAEWILSRKFKEEFGNQQSTSISAKTSDTEIKIQFITPNEDD